MTSKWYSQSGSRRGFGLPRALSTSVDLVKLLMTLVSHRLRSLPTDMSLVRLCSPITPLAEQQIERPPRSHFHTPDSGELDLLPLVALRCWYPYYYRGYRCQARPQDIGDEDVLHFQTAVSPHAKHQSHLHIYQHARGSLLSEVNTVNMGRRKHLLCQARLYLQNNRRICLRHRRKRTNWLSADYTEDVGRMLPRGCVSRHET
jgi:hypothetical protein